MLDLPSHQLNPLSSFRVGEEPYLTFGHWWLASHRSQLRPMNIWGLLSKEAMKIDIKPGMLLSIHKLRSWLEGQPIIPLLEALLPGRWGFGLRILEGDKRPFDFNWMLVVEQFTDEHFYIPSRGICAAVLWTLVPYRKTQLQFPFYLALSKSSESFVFFQFDSLYHRQPDCNTVSSYIYQCCCCDLNHLPPKVTCTVINNTQLSLL